MEKCRDIRISGPPGRFTRSTRALQVVASSAPIHLLIEERTYGEGRNKEQWRKVRGRR